MANMSPYLVSDDALVTLQWILCSSFGMFIIVFGVVTNGISVVCFIHQGFKDPVNISLLGLAISDLLCLIPSVWSTICYHPAINKLDLPFDPSGVQYLTGSWLHVMFSRVTSWITVFITVERCLCVTMPLKVKTLITRKRVTATIVIIYSVLIISAWPAFYINRLGMIFSPTRNKTIFGLTFTEDREKIEAINFAVNNVFVQFSAFLLIIICTFLLVVELRNKTIWREKSVAAAGQVDSSSSRDKRVAKMVVVISSFFIACFTPLCAITIAMIVESRFAIHSEYNNLFIFVNSLGFLCESVHPAVNIFIYYNMSSKYRSTFQRIIFKCRCVTFLK